MQNRVLTLDGVHNFRDFGGYAAAGGAKIRSGLLWRSAQHGDASDLDLEAIHALGIHTIVDLRGPSERESKPCRRHADFSSQIYTYPEETAGLALHTEAADGVITAAEARAAMVRLYEGIPFRENLIPMLRLYVEVLRRNEGPSLVHCVAGKDRTGFAVAVVQSLLGAHRDDVMADYVLTNEASKLEERVASGAFRDMPRYAAFDEQTIRTLWGVEAEYLARSFAALEERHGTIEAYAEAVLGVDAKARDALRTAYLEN